MGLKIRDKKRVEVTTNADSSVLALTIPTTTNSVIALNTKLLGRRNFNSDAYYRVSNHLFKNNSGTVTQIGISQDVFFVADTNVNLATLTFSIVNSDINVYVNGSPNVLSMSWELEVEININ